jgi:elongation factor P hydroxylase
MRAVDRFRTGSPDQEPSYGKAGTARGYRTPALFDAVWVLVAVTKRDRLVSLPAWEEVDPNVAYLIWPFETVEIPACCPDLVRPYMHSRELSYAVEV